MKKILITGISGLLGSNLVRDFHDHDPKKYQIFGTYLQHPLSLEGCTSIQLDLRDHSAVQETLNKIHPEVIIHCAAETNVDSCEKNPESCYSSNVIATSNLCDHSNTMNAKLIYVSSDAVYEGSSGNYSETSETKPINYYGQTKLEAEKEVAKNSRNLILRVNIFGITNVPKNNLSLAEWFIDKLSRGENVKGFTDIYFNPISVNHLSKIIMEAIEKDVSGIYNIGSPETVSKYDFALKLADVFGLDSKLIIPALSSEVNFSAKRPKNSTTNISKAQKKFQAKFPTLTEGLLALKTRTENNKP